MSDTNCIFCKIIDGDIPSAKVYEDEHVYAFLDISQVTEGHTLIIPKRHEKDIFELTEETASNLYKAVPSVAKALNKTFSPEGLNILNNNKEIAGQSVFHYHLHLLPRYGKDDGFQASWADNSRDYDADKLSSMAENISSNLS
ncbi:HIT family protein [Alkalicoccus halolimnae]|uniref:HIT family protein n=1 Tax=Alkalicoccus halolimnae TaxID=1667239 RepID=A0A5C7F924_9BACI|nr:HIT family protein [Alkalicoccus halolimnae]TXF86533.1 HIT family protein [Alkalicoccus halolimnae]